MTAIVPPPTLSAPDPAPPAPPPQPTSLPDFGPKESLWRRHGQLACAITAGILLLTAKIIEWSVTAGRLDVTIHILVGIAFALGLWFGATAAIDSLRRHKLDINLLMVVGAILAIFVGSEMEGALLLFLFTLSGALEHYALQRTHAALESLVKLFPKEALVLAPDGTQHYVALDQLNVGEHILVKPGENVAADGQVVEGTSAVDESAITGEFLPREKGPGDAVFAGTLNTAGRLVVRVGKPAKDTTLAHIIHLVSQASEEKAPVERLFDRVGSAYTISVFGTSLLACLLMALAFGVPWFSIHDAAGVVTRSGAFYRAITLLIVASPCALIISTPVVILSAIATCARRGIILKGGRHLESLAAIRALVFDKTGTLTTGQVRLVGLDLLVPITEPAPTTSAQHCAIQPAKPSDPAALRRRILQAAVALEANSTHPLAAAVVQAGKAEGLAQRPVTNFQQEAGQGLRGTVDGIPCVLGSPALIQGLCPTRTLERLSAKIAEAHTAGQTAVVLFYDGHAAVLRFSDTLRADTQKTIDALHGLGLRPLIMLTGDNRTVAQAVAASLGLDEVRAQLLPEDKLAAITELVGKHQAVGMIGDGINDAPALARATVGIAMGSIGSDAALQAADVVLLSDAIDRVPWLIQTARRARRVMIQNLVFAIAVIVVLVACSLTGIVGLPLGVVGHEGSTLLVVGNGLRLLLIKRG